MSININSEAACRKAYLNYHCYGNTMGVSSSEMGEIIAAWKDKLSSWQGTVTKDENEYEFDDSEFESSRAKGKDAAKEATDFDGKKGRAQVRGISDAVHSAGGAVVSSGMLNGATQGVANAVSDGVGKVWGKVIGEKATKKGSEKLAESGAKAKGSWIIGAPAAAALGAAYMAKKPNKDEKAACDEMQTQLMNAQGATQEAQSEMERMSGELIDLSDEANTVNEDANSDIEDKKTEYDMYKKTYEALKAKIDKGEPLTQEEKALYKEVVGYLTTIGVEIEDLTDETGDQVQQIYDDMGSYQEGYDYAAETIGEIEGQTDFAESFDTATRDMCYVEAAAQGLNVLSGGKAALQAGRFAASGGLYTAWAWAFAAMGAAGAAMSGIGAAQQTKWAGEVGTEIGIRKDTQDMNAATLDTYTEEVDSYGGFMDGVKDLELDIPDDVSAPKDTALPETKTPTDKTDGKKDKEEK